MSNGLLHRRSEAARSAAIRDRPLPRRIFVVAEIKSGWLVVDTDGANVGRIVGYDGDFLVVSRGFISSRLYVPVAGIREVTDGTVKLTLTADQIPGSRWAEKPRRDH